MSSAAQSTTNATAQLVFLERLIYTTLTTLPCCIFLFINGTMLFTLRSKPVFCETCRFILLYNLLIADTAHLSLSQVLYFLSIFRIILTYPQCGVVFMLGSLTNEISPLVLVLMSLERCVAVCFPLRHASIVTVRNTAVSVVGIWAVGLLNVLVKVLLLLQFPFHELETLQMKAFCTAAVMGLTPEYTVYDQAYTSVLFASAGLVIISSYIVVIIAARSASTDKDSALKARNTVLLHLVQLCLSLSSAIHNPLLFAVANIIPKYLLLRIHNVFYLFVMILPRCLSALIYGLRDQTIRPNFIHNLCCRLRLSGITVKAKVSL